MKISKIIKKDLKLFRRDSRTLILTIIAPVLILFIFGNVFGQTTNTKAISGLKLGLCNLDKQETNINIKIFQIEDLGENCSEKARNLVLKGDLRASLVVPYNFSKDIRDGYGSQLELYIDNSKTQTAIMASDSIKALVQDLNEKIGVEFISNAWIKLSELNIKLKFVLNNLIVVRDQAIDMQNKTNNLIENINKIDTLKLENQLNELNQSLSSGNPPYINVSANLTSEITSLEKFYNANCPSDLSECDILNETINRLKELNNNLTEQEKEANNILKNINTTEFSNSLDIIKETKANMLIELNKLNNTLFEYADNIISAINELEETTKLLDTYTSRDPRNIVRAVSLNEDEVFGERTYFEFLAPGLILVLLLFTILLVSSSNIVYERKTGTLARTLLSPTNIPTVIISKLIFFLIISVAELFVMFLTVKLFGVNLPFNLYIVLILLLAGVNFIILGLLLGSLSTSENSALLSSLVLALPMLFLSGLFFPFEIMPPFMKSIGVNLPLTLSIESLDKMVTYSSNIDSLVIVKLIIIPVILGILTYLFIKRKPTAE